MEAREKAKKEQADKEARNGEAAGVVPRLEDATHAINCGSTDNTTAGAMRGDPAGVGGKTTKKGNKPAPPPGKPPPFRRGKRDKVD